MRSITLRAAVAAALALAALPALAAPSALPLAGEQLYALPPEPVVRRVLEALPQMQLGTLNKQLASSERDQLAAGPNEWVARAGTARRKVVGDARYREEEVALERRVRWFGKAAQDRAIGAKGISVAQAQQADDWHEAGRTLMQDWYAALRAQAALRRLAEQHELVRRLKEVAERRVKAGDGAGLDVMQADTELRRSAALLEQARLDEMQALALLQTSYAGLPQPGSAALPEPQPAAGADADQLARILDDNHELELAEVQAEWERLRARRAASERMPDPTVGVRVGREFAGQERIVGLSLSIPLPGALRSAEARSASLRAGMAQERIRQTRLRVELDAKRVLAEQAHRYRLWTEMRDVAGQSARQADLMERAYQAGETTLAEALLVRRQALDAALSAQTAQIAALEAAARVQLDAHVLWSAD